MARVLAVDDDLDILLVVESSLEASGHEVVTCNDPRQVRQTILEHAFDAIVLDVMMPGLTGYDVLHELREHTHLDRVPILFLSAHADSEARIRGLREGADDFLAKPFIPEELVLRVEQLASVGTLVQPSGSKTGKHGASPLKMTLREKRVIGEVYLGRYQALEVIGEGAMGLVFRGWDPRLQRPVALKTLRFEALFDDLEHHNKVAQLLLEATTVARFNHPNLVPVYDVGETEETPFIAMEYVAGVSLSDYLFDYDRLPPSQVIPLAEAIAWGLSAAHASQIVHQDIKPGNILLGRDGAIKVTDFGVAKLLNAINQKEKKLFGTPGFLPPEALRGQGCGEAGDLFSLGSLIYECLTGKEAFSGRTIRDRIFKTLREELPDPRDLAPKTPAVLCELLRELVAKDPESRPSGAQEVAERLAAMHGGRMVWTPAIHPRRLLRKVNSGIQTHHGEPISTVDIEAPLEQEQDGHLSPPL